MSMLSAQCDELRQTAESVGLAMPQAATLMMEAADTIDRLDAENAKLWELGKQYETVFADYRAEVAKLRELVRIAIEYCNSGTCDGCPIQRESGSCPYSDMARKLGVEVD